MPLLSFFVNYSEGESSDPVSSSYCYRAAQHHKQLIPLKFQLYSRQNISLSIDLVQNRLLLRLVQGKYGDNKASVT